MLNNLPILGAAAGLGTVVADTASRGDWTELVLSVIAVILAWLQKSPFEKRAK